MRLPDGGEPCPHSSNESVRLPTQVPGVKVYKEECTQCFATVDDPAGILVCARCFNGGCEKHALIHARKHTHPNALRVRRKRKESATPSEGDGDAQMTDANAQEQITKAALGVPGGLQLKDSSENFEWEWEPCCVSCGEADSWTAVDRTDNRLAACAQEVMESQSAAQADDVKAWDNVRIQCEHTVMLEQPPPESAPQLAAKSLATCGDCELSSNLWLCMTCGHLGCGRRNWDGSGGNNHAVDHNETSGHHVVCKLGTITAEGDADIHCYRCDEERLDPMLGDHLARFGIDIMAQKKTEQTLAELEVEQNLDPSLFSKTREDGVAMKNVYGPGFTGLKNLGNTCYMASILQVAFALPEFQQRYFADGAAAKHVEACDSVAPAQCFLCQTHKLADGMLSGNHSIAPASAVDDDDDDDQEGIPPRTFKALLCADHPDFSSMAQQDAEEFYQFMLESFRGRESRTSDPTKTFDIQLQDRLQCLSCKKARYVSTPTQVLALNLATSAKVEDPDALLAIEKEEERLAELRAKAAATAAARQKAEADAQKEQGGTDTKMKDDTKEKKEEAKPEREDLTRKERASYIPFSACVADFVKDEAVELTCGDCGSKEGAVKRSRLSHFPQTLAVVMRRFTATDWVPRKLGFQIRVEDDIAQTPPDRRVVVDFEDLRGTVPGANGEELMKEVEGAGAGTASGPQVDATVVTALEGMGFPKVRAERAAYETAGRGPEAAMEWLLMHSEDADIDKPLSELGGGPSSGSGAASATGPSADAIAALADMGFSEAQAKNALRKNDNNPERAVEWLFAGGAEEPIEEEAPASAAVDDSAEALPALDENPVKYELCGFVEHRGTSTRSGHYVAYLFKDGRWVQFNDRKVCETDSPPTQFAYMYFFRRLEG